MQIDLTNEEAAALLALADRAIAIDRLLRPKILGAAPLEAPPVHSTGPAAGTLRYCRRCGEEIELANNLDREPDIDRNWHVIMISAALERAAPDGLSRAGLAEAIARDCGIKISLYTLKGTLARMRAAG